MSYYKELIEKKYELIHKNIRKTPIEYSSELKKRTGAEVYLKMENQQASGSFKIRGVMSKIASLSEKEMKKQMVAASTGNHAAAIASASDKLNLNTKIYLPENVSQAKYQALKHYKVELEIKGQTCANSEQIAGEWAREKDAVLVHPYNDLHILAGQGTVAIELFDQLEKINTILVPIGGGGLISGIAAYTKDVNPDTKVIGCVPVNAPEMYESVKKGYIVEPYTLPTISDATAGGMEEGSITFDICREKVDDYILISEEELEAAVYFLIKYHYTLVEAASALPIAALLKYPEKFKGQTVVAVITGKKINPTLLKNILNKYGTDH